MNLSSLKDWKLVLAVVLAIGTLVAVKTAIKGHIMDQTNVSCLVTTSLPPPTHDSASTNVTSKQLDASASLIASYLVATNHSNNNSYYLPLKLTQVQVDKSNIVGTGLLVNLITECAMIGIRLEASGQNKTTSLASIEVEPIQDLIVSSNGGDCSFGHSCKVEMEPKVPIQSSKVACLKDKHLQCLRNDSTTGMYLDLGTLCLQIND